MKIKRIVLGYDFITAFIITILSFCIIGHDIDVSLMKDISKIGINVLSIMFPVFFAALTLILTSSDDSFAEYLQEKGFYDQIHKSFLFVLWIIFITFIISILIFIYMSYLNSIHTEVTSKYILTTFTFLFSYTLFATFNAILDSLRYSKLRMKFLEIKNKK